MSKPKTKKHMAQKTKPAKKTASGKKVVVRKGAIKPARKPAPRKPKLPTFKCHACENDFTDRKAGGWHGDNPRWHCTHCLPRTRKEKTDKDSVMWYVLQCEPGTDSRVRKGVLRTRRIESLEDRILKVISASALQEVVTTERGEVVARGWELDAEPARVAAIRKARELAGMRDGEVGPDGASAVPGYHWHVSQNHDVDKGYGWNWNVRKKPDNPKAVRKVVKVKKFPGYLFVQCKWDGFIDKLVAKVKGAWGFLLRPVINNALVTVVEFKNGRFGWRLRHPETREIIDRFPKKRKVHMGYETKGEARSAGMVCKAEYEAFHPVALKSREAAEMLVQQKAINQIVKDKEELNRVQNAAKVGDTVKIKHPHAFAGVECRVVKVGKGEELTELSTELWGNPLTITAPLWQLEIVRRANTKKETAK